MLEKACPPEAKGITNKILPTHCDGLVAIEIVNDRIFVCNLATKELVVLPFCTLDVRIINEPSTAHGFNASHKQYIVSRYFYRPYDIDVSDRVTYYEIGHEVFMLGGDWELTDAAPDAIGHTWLVLIHGERARAEGILARWMGPQGNHAHPDIEN
jgi:hypothetical protein